MARYSKRKRTRRTAALEPVREETPPPPDIENTNQTESTAGDDTAHDEPNGASVQTNLPPEKTSVDMDIEPRVKPLTTAIVFQCSSCRTIFADTLAGYVASNEKTGTISFSSVRRVAVLDEDEIGSGGWLRRCAFQRLACEECEQHVGWKLNSTTTDCDHLRGVFTFDKASLLSYQLGSCTQSSQEPAFVTRERAVDEANAAFRKALEEDISHFQEAVKCVADGLVLQCDNITTVQGTLRQWEKRFQRLENLDKRLRHVLNFRVLEPVTQIAPVNASRSPSKILHDSNSTENVIDATTVEAEN